MDINNFDSSIDNAMFLTKVDNLFVMLCTSIMMQDLSRVDHKISDNVYKKYESIVNDLKNKNQRHMYDELNVKSSTITNITQDDNGINVEVYLESGFLDYIIDIDTDKIVSGDNTRRTFHNYKLVLTKLNNALNIGVTAHCTSCWASVDINNTGKCPYCGAIFHLEKYDYVLTDIREV